MKKKIESLTPEQTALMAVYRDKWMKIGLCTNRADRPKAEAALIAAYKMGGLKAPERIVWTTSPLAGAITTALLKDEKFIKEFANALKIKKPKKIGDSVWDSVGASVWASVRASVWDSVGASVRASVGDSVWDSVWASVRASVGASVNSALYGQHDANWLGFYDYFREVCHLTTETQKLIPLTDLAVHSSWVYPYKSLAIMSEKPLEVHLNSRGVIHKDLGPSILYPDGFAVWALNGIRVPEWVVMTEADKMDVSEILKLPNAEHRLLAIRKFGPHNMLDKLDGKSISKKGSEYELFELTLEGSKEKILKMQNPSEPKIHYEFVDPKVKTVNEALAYRIGWKTFKEPVAKT